MTNEREAEIRETVALMRARLSEFNRSQAATRLSLAMSEDLLALLDKTVRERDEARRDLGEILAVIHGDGGHHTENVGMAQSVTDAHATWAALVLERDKAQAALIDAALVQADLVKKNRDIQADFDSLEDDAAKVVLAYRNGDKIELDEAVESLASNGRPQWWEKSKPIGLRGESDD